MRYLGLFKFEELLKEIKQSTFYAIDIETNGLNLFGGHKIVGIAYYFPDTDNSYYVPVRHGVGTFSEFTDNIQKKGKKETYSKNKQILDELFQKHLQDEILFSNIPESWYQDIIQVSNENIHKQTWLAHNAQFDCIGLHLDGFELPENIYDTMLSSQVVFSDWYSVKFKMPDTGEKEPGNKRLKWLARLYKLEGAKQGEKVLDEELERLNTFYKSLDDKAHTLTGDEDFKKGVLWSLDPNVVGIYAELDVRLTYELYKKQCIQMDNWNTFEVFERLCFIQRYALLRATLTGFRLDLEKAQYLIVGAKQRLEDIQSEAQEITGVENFNVGSNKQLKEYLASNGLKLPDMQQKTLEPYADNNKLIALRLEYQAVQKVVTGYIEKWYKNNNQGKIHFEFDIATKTYRLSSSSDFYNNGQNILRNTKKELSPKNLLLPTRYDCLLEIDYKSIEMRIGAWIYETLLEGDDNFTLTNLILDGIDMHSYTRDNAEIPQILLDVYGSMEKFLLADGNDLSKIENIEEYFMQRARYLGKQTNFATMYGAGVRGLRKSLPMINAKTASLILSNWHKLYPAPSNASKKLQRIALQPRKLPNADKLGLYFEFPYAGLNPILRYDLYDTVAKNAKGGTYSPLKNVVWKSANWLPQGTASLICTYSIAKISKELGNRIDLHNMVHDSMIFSCDFNELDDILGIIVPIMTDYEVYPQLEVDIEVSRGSWGEKEHYDYCSDNT